MFDQNNFSAIRQHKVDFGHADFEYCILAKEDNAAKRKILESIYIKKLKPVWNGDQGVTLYL